MIVEFGGVLRAFFGPLPELAGIVSGERNDILLGEVAENGMAFLQQLVRAQRNGHVHTIQFPLHPGTAVEPDIGLLQPGLARFFQLPDGLQGRLGTHPVSAVRVGQVTGHVNLVGFDFQHQLFDDVDICLRAGVLLHAAALIERQVQEVDVRVVIQAEGLLKVEIVHILIRYIYPKHFIGKFGECPSCFAQAVIKINVDIHKHPLFGSQSFS